MVLGAGGNSIVIDNVTIKSIGGVNHGQNYYVVNLATPTNTWSCGTARRL